MSTVYQHQLHAHKTHRAHPWRWGILSVLVLTGLVIGGLQFLKPETQISSAKKVTKTLSTETATQTFTKGTFSIDLPKGWQFTSKQQDIYTIYHFKSALAGEDGNRMLDVYEDSSLPNFAVNRMIPVTATEQGGLTTDASLVSDNCSAYTTGTTTARKEIGQIARWQGIDFMCDMANTLRNTVGSGSKDGINTVVLQTPTSRPHRYFFAYTDNNIRPDYNIFANALNSFELTE
jgi:hypothetical protein